MKAVPDRCAWGRLAARCVRNVIMVAAVAWSSAYAAESAPVTSGAARPKIGLALSGGGARGAAHVGVLRVLEEMHVPIDYIAGTSMGSIIGGLYASGMSPDEIEHALKTMDWEHIFDDAPPREDRSFRRKSDDKLYVVKVRPGFNDGELEFPAGAIQGQKFALALRELTLPVSQVTDFDRLHIPFRAMASDIGNGKAVVLGKGDLAQAMRASMAVPGAFAPTRIDGRLLVDGGITSNLPIHTVREMGADIVIAVDISTPYLPEDKLKNLFDIAAQLTSILTRTNAERELATLGERDVLIVPELGDITSGDFDRAGEAIPTGHAAAEAKRAQLAQLSLPASEYRAFLATRSARPDSTAPIVHFVRIENNSPVADGMIRERLNIREGEPLDRQQLEADIGTVYGLGLFQSVRYDVVEENGQTGILVHAEENDWGPNYLQAGVLWSNATHGESSFNVGLAYLRTGINERGGEFRTGVQFGAEPLLGVEWYQPLDYQSRYFINPKTKYGRRDIRIFNEEGDRLAEYTVSGWETDLSIGREFSVFGAGRIGYRYVTGEVDLNIGQPGLPESHFDTAQLYVHLSVDRLDDFEFPTQGGRGELEYATASEDVGSDEDFDQILVGGSRFVSFGQNTFGFAGAVSTTIDGQAPVQNRFRLGGFQKLSGYDQYSLSGQQAAVISMQYYRRYEPLPIFSWYIGSSLEYGGVWEEREDIGSDGILAGSVFLGADTPIGPLYLGYGVAEQGRNAAFLYLGRPFN